MYLTKYQFQCCLLLWITEQNNPNCDCNNSADFLSPGQKLQCCVWNVWKRCSKVQPSTCGSLSLAAYPVLRSDSWGKERARDVVGVWEIDEGIRACINVKLCTCSQCLPSAKHRHTLRVTAGAHLSAWIDKGPPSLRPSPLSPVCWIGPISNTDAALAKFNLRPNNKSRIRHLNRLTCPNEHRSGKTRDDYVFFLRITYN